MLNQRLINYRSHVHFFRHNLWLFPSKRRSWIVAVEILWPTKLKIFVFFRESFLIPASNFQMPVIKVRATATPLFLQGPTPSALRPPRGSCMLTVVTRGIHTFLLQVISVPRLCWRESEGEVEAVFADLLQGKGDGTGWMNSLSHISPKYPSSSNSDCGLPLSRGQLSAGSSQPSWPEATWDPGLGRWARMWCLLPLVQDGWTVI